MELHRTVTRLADGRELIYFDEQPVSRVDVDKRELGPGPTPSELRYDPILDEWIAVAAKRQTRTFLPPADECPLCPSRNGRLTEIPAADYDVAVFENRFPSFAEPPSDRPNPGSGPRDSALWPQRLGVGRCEVICFSSNHYASFASLSPDRARTVMAAWVDRVAALSALDSVEHVFPFENRGEEIGVTLHHPHGQIYGYPFVPPRIRRMLSSASDYRERTGRHLFDDVLAAELAATIRVVASNSEWVAFVPQASHWPVEVHIYPRQRVPTMDRLSTKQQDAFGPLYLQVLRALDANFDLPVPYIAGWYQAPVAHDDDLMALHLEIFSARRAPGKLKYVAGSESAMGAWINDVRPEEMAARLRSLIETETEVETAIETGTAEPDGTEVGVER